MLRPRVTRTLVALQLRREVPRSICETLEVCQDRFELRGTKEGTAATVRSSKAESSPGTYNACSLPPARRARPRPPARNPHHRLRQLLLLTRRGRRPVLLVEHDPSREQTDHEPSDQRETTHQPRARCKRRRPGLGSFVLPREPDDRASNEPASSQGLSRPIPFRHSANHGPAGSWSCYPGLTEKRTVAAI